VLSVYVEIAVGDPVRCSRGQQIGCIQRRHVGALRHGHQLDLLDKTQRIVAHVRVDRGEARVV
jgi:hypothetical protein